MIDAAESLARPRKRRRSRKRKVAESMALVLGVPAIIFAVLALSVELIEYRPVEKRAPDLTGVMPAERIEIPPIKVEPLRLFVSPERPTLRLD